MPSVLLHICCGPCSLYPLRVLREQGFDVTGLFYNPNIHPLQEYVRRRDAMREAAGAMDVPVIVKDDEYDPQVYLRAVAFREENRCFLCYQLRMERTAAIARRGRFDFFSTTLLYSRMQKHEAIRDLGRDLAGGGKCGFLYQDFREGWQEGIERSKAMGMYRQQYCGCIYSEFERYHKRLD